MIGLHDLLAEYVADGSLPGAVGLVARGDETEVAVVGSAAVDGPPMARNSIFRLASITKPITAAAVMILVEDGRIALHDRVDQWLPELANPTVVRTAASRVEDVVPAARPITVFDLLTSRAGYGFPSDFTLPAVQRLFPVQKDGREPQRFPPPDEWMAELSQVPMLYQPGEAWLYDITIDPDERGKGFGRAAMVALESELRSLGHVTVTLNVWGGNVIARDLYTSLGYVEESVHMRKRF